MRMTLIVAALVVAGFFSGRSAVAQTDPNPALNNPDKLAWTLFLNVTTDAKTTGNNSARFETWASDGQTFNANPVWPTAPSPLALKPRALAFAAQRLQANGKTPQVVPGGDETEETRRNKPDFDFIVQNSLFKVSGLKTAFTSGKPINFPLDSIEIKANWIDVNHLHDFNGFSGSPADAAKIYHVNTSGTKSYALVSLHVISKLVPNWTWATFEHKDNPGRCDVIGCSDSFGAAQAFVAPLSASESATHYPDCAKTPELAALFGQNNLDPAFKNYCLKGSQADFSGPTGLAIRVGNSVTEKGFVNQASCMTCHGRAAFDVTGKTTTCAGFDAASHNLPVCSQGNLTNARVGPIDANWFWAAGGPPSLPMLQNESDIQPIALAADFVWSVPFCAIDDTATPPQTTSARCGKK